MDAPSIRDDMKTRLYRREPVMSFEFFPPKDERGVEALDRALSDLAPFQPAFVSVTCGAGGTTRDRTAEVVRRLQQSHSFGVMAHIVACGSSRASLAEQVRAYTAAGVNSFLALRGDPPADQPDWQPAPDQPVHGDEVVRIVRENAPNASIGVAGYPEGHPESPDLVSDIERLRDKIDAGADFVVTQMIFDNETYFDFQRRARNAGIRVPILPGIMAITRPGQIERFRELSGEHVHYPEALLQALDAMGDDGERVRELGTAFAAAQCADLLRRGAPGVHLYTLNQSRTGHAIFQSLRALGWTGPDAR